MLKNVHICEHFEYWIFSDACPIVFLLDGMKGKTETISEIRRVMDSSQDKI